MKTILNTQTVTTSITKKKSLHTEDHVVMNYNTHLKVEVSVQGIQAEAAFIDWGEGEWGDALM